MFCEATSDHDEIQNWARAHGASPAEQLPELVDGHEPVLTFLFKASPSKRANRIVPLSWDEFFAKFDSLGLSFVAADQTKTASAEYKILFDPRLTQELLDPTDA
jgi:hypothetical protein